MYHFVTPNGFEKELRFLKKNGYETITIDALSTYLRRPGKRLPARPIVLTFDDGHRCLYEVAFPLLKKYNYKAVAYICPYWIRKGESSGEPHRSVEDMLEHRVSWPELIEMDKSGTIDVQSHTYDHHKIFNQAEISGWNDGKMKVGHLRWDDRWAPAGGCNPPLGFPLFSSQSRFANGYRFHPNPEIIEQLVRHVESNGGHVFFERNDWKSELSEISKLHLNDSKFPGKFETDDERCAALYADLLNSKIVIEEHLGKEVKHLAFPWNDGSFLSTQIASEMGFLTCVRGPVGGSEICTKTDDPMHIPRFKSGGSEQYSLSLPGKKRRGLLWVIIAQISGALQRHFQKEVN